MKKPHLRIPKQLYALLKHLPNTLTLLNLACGILAILSVFQGKDLFGFYWVLVAATLDFLDGFTARLLNAHSNIGKDLDSLADCVTFGVVPGIYMMKAITSATCDCYHFPATLPWEAYLGIGISLMSALRLAVFNNDSRQTDSFIGVPTPANTLFVVSLVCSPLLAKDSILVPVVENRNAMVAFALFSAASLVSPIPMLALKFKNWSFRDNYLRYLLIIVAVLLMIMNLAIAIPIIIVCYFVLSLIKHFFKL